MARAPQTLPAKKPTFSQAVEALRSKQFEVREQSGSAVKVAKYGCAAVITAGDKENPVAYVHRPGVLYGEQISTLVDRGFQKFFKVEQGEFPATAEHLQALHRFTEELRVLCGQITLYNEALGTVTDVYLYDRVKGNELPLSKRPKPAWELAAK